MPQNIVLWDAGNWQNLLPFTYTRPVSEIRIGILTIREKYEKYFGGTVSWLTEKYLSKKFKTFKVDDNLVINAGILPDVDMISAIKGLKTSETLWKDQTFIAARISSDGIDSL